MGMPLRDHFNPPLSDFHSHDGLLGGWPMVMVQGIQGELPQAYRAGPMVGGFSTESEVRVFDRQSRRLVSLIVLLGPGTAARRAIDKSLATIREGVSLVVVDVVTVSTFNLYAKVLEELGESDATLGARLPPTYAVACRRRSHEGRHLFESWNYPLAVGEPLPTLPLWLGDERAIPLDLETSYERTCRDLRIIQ